MAEFILGFGLGAGAATLIAGVTFEKMRRRGQAYLDASRTLLVLDWPRRRRR